MRDAGRGTRGARGAPPDYEDRAPTLGGHHRRDASGTESPRAGPPVPRPALGTLRVAASACCFGTIPVFTVLATQRGGAPLPSVLAWRYALAAVALALVSGGLAGLRPPRRRAVALLAVGGSGQALVTYLRLSALRYLPAATVAFPF